MMDYLFALIVVSPMLAMILRFAIGDTIHNRKAAVKGDVISRVICSKDYREINPRK